MPTMSRKCCGLAWPRPNGTADLSFAFQSFWIRCEDMKHPLLAFCGNATQFDFAFARRYDRFTRLSFGFSFAEALRPDVKPTVRKEADFPRAPDAFALAKAAIRHVVSAHVSFRPGTLQGLLVVLAVDHKAADVIVAIATQLAGGKGKVHVHAVLFFRTVIVKTRPRTGRKKFVAH